jgi:hypothetical protein
MSGSIGSMIITHDRLEQPRAEAHAVSEVLLFAAQVPSHAPLIRHGRLQVPCFVYGLDT